MTHTYEPRLAVSGIGFTSRCACGEVSRAGTKAGLFAAYSAHIASPAGGAAGLLTGTPAEEPAGEPNVEGSNAA